MTTQPFPSSPCEVPILLVVFNRPDLARAMLELLAAVQPRRLYVAADGPRPERPERPDEAQRVAEVQQLFSDGVTWDCQVFTRYQEQNCGCKQHVVAALRWVFAAEEQAIILEDDCLPDPSFFPFCQELLARYAHDQRVGMIGGRNNMGTWKNGEASYLFATGGSVWGWATWRRVVEQFSLDDPLFADPRLEEYLYHGTADRHEAAHIAQGIRDSLSGANSSWAYLFCGWLKMQHYLSINPCVNVVANRGMDGGGTHSTAAAAKVLGQELHSITWPLRHPPVMVPDLAFSMAKAQLHVQVSQESRLRRCLRRIPGLRLLYRGCKALRGRGKGAAG